MNDQSKLLPFLKKSKSFLAVILVLPLLGAISPIQAQEDESDEDLDFYELSTFEVDPGFAGSLAFSTEAKRRAPVIVEVISAEDIGKLPDVSIAETLARLPGLTTQRINSRAQDIVIRGLTGDFSTALLNGRQQVSASGDRSVEFDQYPGELLNGVVVYKTTQPNLVGQGLAGTVDMRTVRPLGHGKKTFVANAFYEWTDLNQLNPDVDINGTRFSMNYIDQNDDETIGWAFGYSNTNRPGQGEQWNAWGNAMPTFEGNMVLGGVKPFVRSSVLDRDSFLAVFESRPHDNLHTTFDIFFSNFAEEQILRGIEFPLLWSSASLQPGFTVEDGLITRGTFTGVYGVMRNDIVWRDADVYSPGWNLVMDTDNGWQFELDLSHSNIDRTDYVLETYSGWGSNRGNGGAEADWSTPDTLSFMMGGGTGATFSSNLDYSSDRIRLASPQGWGGNVVPGGQLGFFKGPIAKDELNQARTAIRRDLEGIFNEMEFGLAWTERVKSETNPAPEGRGGWFLALADGSWSAPFPETIGNADLSFIGIGPQRAYDTRAVFDSGIYDLIPNNHPNNINQNYHIEEEVTTGYMQFIIDTRLGTIPVTGTLGTQLIRTNQFSRGGVATFDGSGGLLIGTATDSHSYTDLVPSLNLIFEIDDLRRLRFSVARQLARQEMDDMRASASFNFNESLAGSTDVVSSPWSGRSGNPELEPWRSNSLDLSFENYFADNMGYWAIAGYHKDLVSYTYLESLLSDFTGYPTGVPGVTPAIFQGFRTKPQNGQGGEIYGLEVSLSLPGEKLSEALEGFGVLLNASLTKSSIEPNLGDPAQPIPGLSENIYNATVYYEKGGFEARASGRYRSDFRGDIATFGFRGPNFRNILAETVFDAQLSYEYESGILEGLTIILQGYNLTDEPLIATFGDKDLRLVKDYHRWGAQYSLGASYKF